MMRALALVTVSHSPRMAVDNLLASTSKAFSPSISASETNAWMKERALNKCYPEISHRLMMATN